MRAETAGFEKASHEYERGRPGYPDLAVDFVVKTAGLGPEHTVVDLAAGTGKLTRELVERGLHVVAVEPLEQMRSRLAEQLPEVEARAGTAQSTGLPACFADAVTIAQAFHWFAGEEALEEIERILRPEGTMFLLWNRRDLTDPVQTAVSRLTAPYLGDAPSYTTGRWRQVMTDTRRFVPCGEEHCAMVQRLDRAGLVDRVVSTSYIANLPDDEREVLAARVAALVPETGTVHLPYLTDVYAYRRTALA